MLRSNVFRKIEQGDKIDISKSNHHLEGLTKNKIKPLKLKNFTLNFNRILLMGILNATPDSFSDGGKYLDIASAVKHAHKMEQDGADIIDIGGVSTRPGSVPISTKEELSRVAPILKKVLRELNVPVSIDTFNPYVAKECLKLGAQIINDVTGLRNQLMLRAIRKYEAAVIIMHMKGNPKKMQINPKYKNVVSEISSFFQQKIILAEKNNISGTIIDPGIGFGKTVEHNLILLKNLKEFKSFGYPVLIGTSRKSFIGKISNVGVDERIEGTIASNIIAAMNGANILRVHDVKECKRAVEILDAMRDV